MRLARPALALTWMGLGALVLHAGMALGPLVVLSTSEGLWGSPFGPPQPAPQPSLDDVLAAAFFGTSISWMLLGGGLIAAGLAMRSGTHRAAIQAACVFSLPLAAMGIAEGVWLQPCSLPGALAIGVFHGSIAMLAGWLALHLARPVGRDAFVSRRESAP